MTSVCLSAFSSSFSLGSLDRSLTEEAVSATTLEARPRVRDVKEGAYCPAPAFYVTDGFVGDLLQHLFILLKLLQKMEEDFGRT